MLRLVGFGKAATEQLTCFDDSDVGRVDIRGVVHGVVIIALSSGGIASNLDPVGRPKAEVYLHSVLPFTSTIIADSFRRKSSADPARRMTRLSQRIVYMLFIQTWYLGYLTYACWAEFTCDHPSGYKDSRLDRDSPGFDPEPSPTFLFQQSTFQSDWLPVLKLDAPPPTHTKIQLGLDIHLALVGLGPDHELRLDQSVELFLG